MPESLSTVSEKKGLPPGSLIHVGSRLETETKISVLAYNGVNIKEQVLESVDEIHGFKASDSVTWVIVEGLANVGIVERIGTIFGVHQLILEDILNTHQRAKLEEYNDHLYIVLKCLTLEEGRFNVAYEQVSILMFTNVVIVFKEKKDDLFHPIQKRIKASKGLLRKSGADYLTYTILDTIVDQNFIIIDSLDDVITSLEDRLLSSELKPDVLHTIQKLKREVIRIRKYVSPVRELMAEMRRSESELIHEKTQVYLRDVYDHVIRVVESIESYREMLTGLLDIYISGVSNKMNEIMKVLTIFASIFIPLTFIAGIYGMNFEYMPELKLKWAYPFLWVLFITISVALLVFFRRKKWL